MSLLSRTTIPYQVIIAHGPRCIDGITSAWLIWRLLPTAYREQLQAWGGLYASSEFRAKFMGSADDFAHWELEERGDEGESPEVAGENPHTFAGALRMQERGFPIVFCFAQHCDEVPRELVRDRSVLILDLDLGPNLAIIVEEARQVLLLDHHASSAWAVKGVPWEVGDKLTAVVDITQEQSACSLTWQQFYSEPLPPLVRMVQLADTKSYDPALPSEVVLRSLFSRGSFGSFPDLEETYTAWRFTYNSDIKRGEIMLEYDYSQCHKIAQGTALGYLQTTDGTVYAVAYLTTHRLTQGLFKQMKKCAKSRFTEEPDFYAVWRYAPHVGLVTVSLRYPRGDIDLATVAANIVGLQRRGGGHNKVASEHKLGSSAGAFSFRGIENLHNFLLRERPPTEAAPLPQGS